VNIIEHHVAEIRKHLTSVQTSREVVVAQGLLNGFELWIQNADGISEAFKDNWIGDYPLVLNTPVDTMEPPLMPRIEFLKKYAPLQPSTTPIETEPLLQANHHYHDSLCGGVGICVVCSGD